MKINIILLFIITFFHASVIGQKTNYCDIILKKARIALDKDSLSEAIKELKKLEICDYKDSLLEIRDNLQTAIFIKIQKREAELNKTLIELNAHLTAEKIAKVGLLTAINSVKIAKGIADQALADASINANNALGYSLIWKSQINSKTDPTLALQLALEAMNHNKDSTIETEVYRIYNENLFYKIVGTDLRSVYLSPNKDFFFTENNEGIFHLNDWNGKSVTFLKISNDNGYHYIFSPDEKTLLSTSIDTVFLWNQEGRNTGKFITDKGLIINSAKFSPDGKTILVNSENSSRLFDLRGNKLTEFGTKVNGDQQVLTFADFSPDGSTVLTKYSLPNYTNALSGNDSLQRVGCKNNLWRINGEAIRSWNECNGNEYFLPGSKGLLITADTGTVTTAYYINPKGEKIMDFSFLAGNTIPIGFSPSGDTIITIPADEGKVKFWNLKGEMIREFLTDSNFVGNDIEFSPGGKLILMLSNQFNRAIVTDLDGKLIKKIRVDNDGGLRSAIFSPDETKLLAYTPDTLSLYNLDVNKKNDPPREYNKKSEGNNSFGFSPDGKLFFYSPESNQVNFRNLNGDLVQELKGHAGSLDSVWFSPDGKGMLSYSDDGSAYIWDLSIVKESKMAREFKGDIDRVLSVAYSPDGKTFLTGSSDGTARLWGIDGNLIREFKEQSDIINSVAFSPDGKTFLCGSNDNNVYLWSLDGNMIRKFTGLHNTINAVTFSPDGKTILAASGDSVHLWDINAISLMDFIGHYGKVTSVAFSPDGKKILTGSYDATARLWDTKGQTLQVFKGHSDRITSVAFSPDGKIVLTGSADHSARLWDLNGKIIKVFTGSTTFPGSTGHSSIITAVAFSPNGKTILTGSYDKTAILWNLAGDTIHQFRGHKSYISTVAFSPDGNSLLTGSQDHTARIWNINGGLIVRSKGNTKEIIYSVRISPDGKTVLTGSADETARLYDMEGNVIREFRGHNGYINAVSFSPNGSKICTGSADGTVCLWDTAGNLIRETRQHKRIIQSIIFSPDGSKICTGSLDSTAKIWDLRSDSVKEFIGHKGAVNEVVFTPDGKNILTCSSDKTARLWKLGTDSVTTFKGHISSVLSIDISPDGKTVATGSYDHTIRLWDMNGKLLRKIQGGMTIWRVRFSPDRKNILTGLRDGGIQMFNLSGIPIQEFSAHVNVLNDLAFSRDGKTFITASSDKTARLWYIPLTLDDFLKSGKLQPLSPQQKKEYGIPLD
jgi:WD40 repeat protein